MRRLCYRVNPGRFVGLERGKARLDGFKDFLFRI